MGRERRGHTSRSDSKTAAALLLLRQRQIALGDLISGTWAGVKGCFGRQCKAKPSARAVELLLRALESILGGNEMSVSRANPCKIDPDKFSDKLSLAVS